MRRRLLLALLLVLMSVGLPARADFHGACSPFFTGKAKVELTMGAGAGAFDFLGSVHCPGAGAQITIESVTFRNVTTSEILATIARHECAPGETPCVSSSTQATSPGLGDVLEVRMIFDVDNPATPGQDYNDVVRIGRWTFGEAALIPICIPGEFQPGLGVCS